MPDRGYLLKLLRPECGNFMGTLMLVGHDHMGALHLVDRGRTRWFRRHRPLVRLCTS